MAYPRWSIDEVLRSRPPCRINQVGYLPNRPMRATLVSAEPAPLPFSILDQHDRVLHAGWSDPWPVRPEPSSGLSVHVLDFTASEVRGRDLQVDVADSRSHRFTVSAEIYRTLTRDALGFFRLMRSGTALGDDVPLPYVRPAGHLGRAPNTGDTAVPAWTGPDAERLYPGWSCPGTFDVSGGWYDAGDYGKYVTSGAPSAWQLLSTLDLLSVDRSPAISDLATAIRSECRWQLDWLLRMQVPDGAPLGGMAFHRVHGTRWSPVPGWPHRDPTVRVLHRPSTPATWQLAAVSAHASRYVSASDAGYADRLLTAARTAYRAAARHPDLLAPDDQAEHGGGPYHDDDPSDDHYWAAVELWLATGEPAFLDDVRSSPHHHADVFTPSGFDDVAGPARLDLAVHARGPEAADARASVIAAADDLVALQATQPWGQPYAPAAGWAWGSNGCILNNLVILAVAHRISQDHRYADGVAGGIDYLLGRNAIGQSYVTGYGTDDTRHQRTRQFGHDLDPTMPPPPPGALAGGANSLPVADFPYDDRLVGLPPQQCYLDEPTSEVTNDICIRWNAPLVFVSTFLHLTTPGHG